MRSLPIALIACLAALAVGSSCILDRTAGFEPDGTGASGAGGGGTGGVIMMGCEDAADCGGTTDCTTAVDCVNGACVPTYAPPGTACVVEGDEDKQYCNGTGSCVQCALAEHCAAGTCSFNDNSGEYEQEGGGICVAGVCQAVEKESCGDFTCNAAGTNCLTSCMDNEDCSDGTHVCDPLPMGTGDCGDPLVVGTPCGADGACASTSCVDGVCCESECASQCQACSMTLTGSPDGTCANIPLGVDDPDEPCALGLACQGDGTCTACGETTTAVVMGCPGICDGGCSGGNAICNINCDAANDCQGQINCPPGKDCNIDCSTTDACPNVTVSCPPGRSCKLTCANPAGSCAGATLNCTDGPCEIDCKNGGNGNCAGTTINCGPNACDVKCSASGEPAFNDPQMSCSLTTDGECP